MPVSLKNVKHINIPHTHTHFHNTVVVVIHAFFTLRNQKRFYCFLFTYIDRDPWMLLRWLCYFYFYFYVDLLAADGASCFYCCCCWLRREINIIYVRRTFGAYSLAAFVVFTLIYCYCYCNFSS